MDARTFAKLVEVRFALVPAVWFLLLTNPADGAATAPRATSSVAIEARIEALVKPQADAELLSGVILVARGDRVVFQKAYGFADWESRVSITGATRFGIGSITKPMTEILVRGMAKTGRIRLEAPVEAYLPGFPRGPNGGKPTVNDLLTHRSGVPHRVTEPIEETQELWPSDIVQRVRAKGLLFEPGSQRLYSSAGFTCLARIVEIIEGKPFEVIIAERIFGPAGMASATSPMGPRLIPGRAEQYRLGAADERIAVKAARCIDLTFLTGAGSVYATSEDLLRLVRAVQKGVFGKEVWHETFGDDPAAWQGWTGRANGYEASVDVLPAENLVFVFLSNLRSAANWQVREQIQKILRGRDASAIPLPPPVARQFEEPESLVGSYGSADVSLDHGQLFRGDSEFYPIEGKRYYSLASGWIMRFRRDAGGEIDAMVSVSASGEEVVLQRSSSP